MSDARRLAILALGRVPYHEAHALQRRLAEAVADEAIDHDLLLLLEHEPTVTLGRATKETSLLVPPDSLAQAGITVAEVERGGDVTWHGPGQLVGYPILHLARHQQDLHWYLRMVEEALIVALDALGIPAERNPGFTGVWTAGRKIASIGIHVRRWVTTHGFALNVHNDLADFARIVPCGITGVEMTSVAQELGAAAHAPADAWNRTATAVVAGFARTFGLVAVPTGLDAVLARGTPAQPRAY